MAILFLTFIQLLFGLAPLIGLIWIVVKARQYQNEQRKNNTSAQGSARSSTPDWMKQVKAEFQKLSVEEQQKRNAHVVQKRPAAKMVAQQPQKSELQAAQKIRERQIDERKLQPLRVEPQRPKPAPSKRKPTTVSLKKKDLVHAVIYKEILDKPLALRK